MPGGGPGGRACGRICEESSGFGGPVETPLPPKISCSNLQGEGTEGYLIH